MTLNLKTFLREHWPKTNAVLFVLSAVSGFFTYEGAAMQFAGAGAGLMSSASAAVFSVGVTAGMYLFWHFALNILPQMRTPRSRLAGISIMALGCPFLVALSAWLNVTALAGPAALEVHMTKAITAYEGVLDASVRQAQLPGKLVPDFKSAADRYAGLAQGERTGGRISGVAGAGGVADMLEGASRDLRGAIGQIQESGQRSEKLASAARASLERMRGIASEEKKIEERLRAFAAEADVLKGTLAQMDHQGLLESLARTMNGLSGTLIERVTSRNADVAGAQKEASARIREDLERTGKTMAETASRIAQQPAVTFPAFERINAMQAVAVYAGSFIPSWAGGVALDLLPTLLVLYLMLAHAVAGDVPEEEEETSGSRTSAGRFRDRAHAQDDLKDAGFAGRLVGMLRAFSTMSPQSFALMTVTAIILLVVINIVSAALPPLSLPDLGFLTPASGQADCVDMPDGVRVCEETVAASAAAGDGAAAMNARPDGGKDGGFFEAWSRFWSRFGKLPNTIQVRDPSPLAIGVVRRITDAVGLKPNFRLVEADFDQDQWAYAIVWGRQRHIVYDKKRLPLEGDHPRWEDVTILAHEIGHHLNGHLLDDNGSHPVTELEADEFAGFAVSRLDGSLENALSVYRNFSKEGGKTHPPRAERLKAVETGWRRSESLKKRETVACVTDWLEAPFKLGGQSCRMARVCRGKEADYRLACERRGRWTWQRPA